MDKYSTTVKYWIDNNFGILLLVGFLLVASICFSQLDNLLFSEELGHFFSSIALILSFYVSIKLAYWLLSLDKELHINDYKIIIQLLEEKTLTPSEVAKISNNEVIIYKDYFQLCVLSNRRKTSNKKTQAINEQVKELKQTKQSLNKYFIEDAEKSDV